MWSGGLMFFLGSGFSLDNAESILYSQKGIPETSEFGFLPGPPEDRQHENISFRDCRRTVPAAALFLCAASPGFSPRAADRSGGRGSKDGVYHPIGGFC